MPTLLIKNGFRFFFFMGEPEFKASHIHVLFVDGRRISVPLDFYPLLCNVRMEVLQDFEIFREGTAIYFRKLDEYLSVEGLVNGCKQILRLEQLKK